MTNTWSSHRHRGHFRHVDQCSDQPGQCSTNPFAESSASLKASNNSSSFLSMLPAGWAHHIFVWIHWSWWLSVSCIETSSKYIYSGFGTSSTGSGATVAFGSSVFESTFGNKLSVNHGVPSSPVSPAYCRNQACWTHYCPQNCQGRKEQQTWCQEGGKGV